MKTERVCSLPELPDDGRIGEAGGREDVGRDPLGGRGAIDTNLSTLISTLHVM